MATIPGIPCKVIAPQEAYFKVYSGWAFALNSPYVGLFDHELRKIRQSGIVDREVTWILF